jgi:hypothetical protein
VHVILIDCRASLPEIIIAFCDNAKCWFATRAPFSGVAPHFPPSRLPLWLPGVFPFFRPAALAAGVCVSLSVPISHFPFSGDREPMSDRDLIDAVAHVTGEDSHEIRRRDFVLTGPEDYGSDLDPECLLDVLLVDLLCRGTRSPEV